jgi:hypothetical protein
MNPTQQAWIAGQVKQAQHDIVDLNRKHRKELARAHRQREHLLGKLARLQLGLSVGSKVRILEPTATNVSVQQRLAKYVGTIATVRSITVAADAEAELCRLAVGKKASPWFYVVVRLGDGTELFTHGTQAQIAQQIRRERPRRCEAVP